MGSFGVCKNVRMLVGAPGSPDAAQLGQIVEFSKKFASMGGVMVWDASHLQTNPGLLGGIKKLAKGIVEGVVGILK